jgi:hypothetical protein
MAILTERIFDEINSTVKSTLGLSNNAIVTKATKFVRFDWRALIHFFETEAVGIEPPYCIIRPGPAQEESWGMAVHAYSIPIEVFFVENAKNRFTGTVTTAVVAGITVETESTTKLFVGQRLYFETADSYRFVATINSATEFTVDTAITLADGEEIRSDLPSDVETKMDMLRTAFRQGTVFTNFQLMEDPLTDVSDMNPVNEHMGESNYSLFAGSCFFKALVGEIL